MFVTVRLSVHHLPYRFDMSIHFQGFNQMLHPRSGYAVFWQPLTGNERQFKQSDTMTVESELWLIKVLNGLSPQHLPKLFQWRAVLDNSGECTRSCTTYSITYQAII